MSEVEGRLALKRQALRDLVAKELVQRSGAGKRNDPYLYSRSLVPAIYGEQEKQETKAAETPDFPNPLSRSQDLPVAPPTPQEDTLPKTEGILEDEGNLGDVK